jgi:2-hydroxy-3-keto-5-methylthiopentenyl-1-phosphate phosphatase
LGAISQSIRSGKDIAILCDFDGTLTPVIVIDLLYEKYARCGLEFTYRWERGEISTMEEIQSTFATVTASREEMESTLAELDLTPGADEFISFCHDRDYEFGIVSDGLKWYIEYILKRHDLEGLKIYANEIHFGDDGGFHFSFPWFDEQTPLRATSKPSIIQRFQDEGYRVIFIGDGISDFEVVGIADKIYARSSLAEHCRSMGIPAIGFSDFTDLLEKWEED